MSYKGPTIMSGMKQCGREFQQHMMQWPQMQMKMQPPFIATSAR